MAASKTWKKLKFASKFGNKAELAKDKVEEEEEQDYLYKIVKEPDPKYKNIIREYSQIVHFVFLKAFAKGENIDKYILNISLVGNRRILAKMLSLMTAIRTRLLTLLRILIWSRTLLSRRLLTRSAVFIPQWLTQNATRTKR